MKDDNVVISVNKVSKDFKLPHEKVSTIKGLFTSSLKRKNKSGYEVQHALKNITFQIKRGEFFGIVGRNGSGKSTLLKILAGIYQPTSGSVEVDGKLVPFIELGVGFNPELTGRENVFLNGAMLGFSQKEVNGMYKDIVKFAELERFMDQKLKNYSSGMQVRLAFSMAIRAQADILLVDEVLAVGDADFQRKCFDYFKKLKKDKKTVVFVSHDMGAVREFCDRALLIDASEIKDIGKTTRISNRYSQLFLDPEDLEDNEEKTKLKKRWGNGAIKINDVKAMLIEDKVVFDITAKVNKPLDGVMYGLHILSPDGGEVTAVNNRMIRKPDLRYLKQGTYVKFTWEVLNIFSDGRYDVTLTLVDEAGIAFDWFTEATTFRVKRIDRSTTPVLPPINVEYKVVKSGEVNG